VNINSLISLKDIHALILYFISNIKTLSTVENKVPRITFGLKKQWEDEKYTMRSNLYSSPDHECAGHTAEMGKITNAY
jgi:hypothetical protein